MLVGFFGPQPSPRPCRATRVILQFGLSGAATVLVAAALREALLRLDEAKAAEAEVQADLPATEARFRILADSAPVLMWVSRLDGTREFVNRAYCEFLGARLRGRAAASTGAGPDPPRRPGPRSPRRRRAAMATGGDFIWEARYRRADGEYRVDPVDLAAALRAERRARRLHRRRLRRHRGQAGRRPT